MKVFPKQCRGSDYFEKFQFETNVTKFLKYSVKSGDCLKILYHRHLEEDEIKKWKNPKMLGIRFNWSFNNMNISKSWPRFENNFSNVQFRKLALMLEAASRKGSYQHNRKTKIL